MTARRGAHLEDTAPTQEGQCAQPSGCGDVYPAHLAGQTWVESMVSLVIRKLLRLTEPRSEGSVLKLRPAGAYNKFCMDKASGCR